MFTGMGGPKLPEKHMLRQLPVPAKRLLSALYWRLYDGTDFVAEAIGLLLFHGLRLFLYRHLLGVRVGSGTSIHRHCRFYRPRQVRIGQHSVINRDVLLDGRMELTIGDNVSISEGVALITLGHDPQSRSFDNWGAPIHVGNRVFIGTRAMVLPGVSLCEGSVVGAGAVVTKDVAPFTIVAGVPARDIGERSKDLAYTLDYRKFLG